MKLISIFLCILFFSKFSIAQNSTYTFQAQNGQVEFFAKGRPALISIHGKGPGPVGTIEWKEQKLNGSLEIDLKELSTGISLRDEHMLQKYLEVSTHPNAVLKIENLDFNGASPQKLSFKGKLSLHGVDKEVEGHVDIKGDGALDSIVAEFNLKLSEFQIAIPSFKGITVAEDVKIQVTASQLKQITQ